MGTWSHRIFDNDAAADWIAHLDGKNQKHVHRTLRKVVNDRANYPETDDCEEALAAAELVAASAGVGIKVVTSTAKKCLGKIKLSRDENLVKLARQAIAVILANSELKDNWDGTEGESKWHRVVKDLDKRLRGLCQKGKPFVNERKSITSGQVVVQEGDILAIPIGKWAFGVGKVLGFVTQEIMRVGFYDLIIEDLVIPLDLPQKTTGWAWAVREMVQLDSTQAPVISRPTNNSRKKPIVWIRIGHLPLTKTEQKSWPYLREIGWQKWALYCGQSRQRAVTEREYNLSVLPCFDAELDTVGSHVNAEFFFSRYRYWAPKGAPVPKPDLAKCLKYRFSDPRPPTPKDWRSIESPARMSGSRRPLDKYNSEYQIFKAKFRPDDGICEYMTGPNPRMFGLLLVRDGKPIANYELRASLL